MNSLFDSLNGIQTAGWIIIAVIAAGIIIAVIFIVRKKKKRAKNQNQNIPSFLKPAKKAEHGRRGSEYWTPDRLAGFEEKRKIDPKKYGTVNLWE
jgi:cell division protein FtsN